MRRFAFRLQKALDHAAHVERERHKELAVARRNLARGDRALMALLRERDEALHESRQHRGNFDVAGLSTRWTYAGHLRRRIEFMKRTIEALAGEVKAKRTALLEASKTKTLLERLRKHKLAEHTAMAGRHEQMAQDEAATTRHLRAL